jgi:hypothetical protein
MNGRCLWVRLRARAANARILEFCVLELVGVLACTVPESVFACDGGVMRSLTSRELLGIYGRKMWETWRMTASLLHERGMDVSPIVTHTFEGLGAFADGFGVMQRGECGKVVFFPHGEAAARAACLK